LSRSTGDRPPIRAVIFDIGGIVEPPFDDILVRELAAKLGIEGESFRRRRAEHALALTQGRLTLADFYERVVTAGHHRVDPNELLARHLAVYAAETARLDARVLGLIEALRRRYLVACLTNTEVEVGRYNRDRGLFGSFDRAFLSTELGLGKPDRAVFERVLADLRCGPQEAVFIDDNPVNTAGARTAGIHAIHYRDFESFSRDLARVLEPGA
jgi:HAD superfamily hydrolase (TIGR01509 family)